MATVVAGLVAQSYRISVQNQNVVGVCLLLQCATICVRPSIGVVQVQSAYHLPISEPCAPHHHFVDWNQDCNCTHFHVWTSVQMNNQLPLRIHKTFLNFLFTSLCIISGHSCSDTVLHAHQLCINCLSFLLLSCCFSIAGQFFGCCIVLG